MMQYLCPFHPDLLQMYWDVKMEYNAHKTTNNLILFYNNNQRPNILSVSYSSLSPQYISIELWHHHSWKRVCRCVLFLPHLAALWSSLCIFSQHLLGFFLAGAQMTEDVREERHRPSHNSWILSTSTPEPSFVHLMNIHWTSLHHH